MSTYNGKKFLCEQLDSILSQTNVEVEIFIRDDGSTDGTKEILDKYAVKEGIHVDYAENVGVGNSFMNLLYSVPSDFDYYAFPTKTIFGWTASSAKRLRYWIKTEKCCMHPIRNV